MYIGSKQIGEPTSYSYHINFILAPNIFLFSHKCFFTFRVHLTVLLAPFYPAETKTIIVYFYYRLTFGFFLAFYLLTVICVSYDGYYIGLGRMNRNLARELSVHSILSTISCNWIRVSSALTC